MARAIDRRAQALHEGRIRPTREDLLAARGKTLPDLIAPDLKVLFCGINPGLYTAAVGHHFARPGNRFWPALHQAGFTPRLYSPYEEEKLLDLGLGLTNLVARATAGAAELTREELQAGAEGLKRKVAKYRPRAVAILGLGAYRIAFKQRDAVLGIQAERIGEAAVWVLPSPSGANAYYQPRVLVAILRQLSAAT
ncbi:MAG: G/U mismatch-specific DNA glycosylase [Gammaproteobacteria bacterium]|nr:G/U mismatch-specific DNA glycosylase [Gammaproteobacteria bacterium]